MNLETPTALMALEATATVPDSPTARTASAATVTAQGIPIARMALEATATVPESPTARTALEDSIRADAPHAACS